MGTLATHVPLKGRDTLLRCSLLPLGERIAPTVFTITIGSGGALKGATTIPVAGVTGEIQAGQYLLAIDPATGKESMFKLNTAAEIGDTSLDVLPLDEDVIEDSTVEFPPEFWDRNDSGIDKSYDLSSFQTYNTGGKSDGVVTGSTVTVSFPGIFYWKNPSARTMEEAADEGRECWVIIERPVPSLAFSKGVVASGAVAITSINNPAPTDGFIGQDFSMQFQGGSYSEAKPTPIP